MKAIRYCCLILMFAVVATCSFAMTATEQTALNTVKTEIKSALAGKSEFARNLGRYTDFYRELLKVLKKYPEVAEPKTMFIGEKAAKILVPLKLSEKQIGGFFQVSSDGKQVLSYLIWDKTGTPLFKVDAQKWNSAKKANELEELKELVPIQDNYSAGTPVELSDLQNAFIIDYIDMLPSKTQEEREEYTSKNGLKSTLGRRTASSKCLSYAASLASDWWNIAQGNKLGKYDSFVNGAREFGMNPRIVESLYFNFPKCPYAFIKETGLDRVTGEKIPYSPKNYAYIMSSIDAPKSFKDPLKKQLTHKIPANAFGMDLPFMNSFNKCNGKVEKIKQDLQRYGIMYAQHTSRLFKDKVSLTVQGVHAVNIVGTGVLKGEPVVLYYETFGKNKRDYLEDSFYGPRLRAFPVKFFYQGIVFPHRIIADVRPGKNEIVVRFLNHEGKKIQPSKLQVKLNGKVVKVRAGSVIQIPASFGNNKLELSYSRKYFYTPEEPNGYERVFMISGSKVVELKKYEATLKALAERSGGLFAKIFGKKESYNDFLKKSEEELRAQLKQQITAVRQNKDILKMISDYMISSRILKSSDAFKMVNEVMKFNKLADK